MQRLRQILSYIFVFLFFFAIFVWHNVGIFAQAQSASGTLSVAFLDVGQGDAIYIRAPNGADMLVDGGRDNSVLQKLTEVMPAGDRALDIVLATHPDADHIGGLPKIFDEYDVGAYFDPGTASETKTYHTLMQKILAEKSTYLYALHGTRVVLDTEHSIYVDILYPDKAVKHVRDTNAQSVVLRVVYADTAFLLTGDAPIAIETKLVARSGAESISSDVLKLGHHGSRTSSSRVFLQTVQPQVAIISAGKNNRYGHPHKEVLNTLKNLQVPFLTTYDEGTIIYQTDGKTVTRVEK